MNDFYNVEYLSERVAALAQERDNLRRELNEMKDLCERQARLSLVNAKLALDLDKVTAERDELKKRSSVRSGRWLEQRLFGQQAWDCSECKTLGSPHWKWCPVCGADMRGE